MDQTGAFLDTTLPRLRHQQKRHSTTAMPAPGW